MIKIDLPWIEIILTPNKMDGIQRNGGRKAAYAIRSARERVKSAAYYATLEAISESHAALCNSLDYHVTVISHRPAGNGRGPDNDAISRAMKPALDGISMALGVNDWHFDPLEYKRGYPVANGAITVLIDSDPLPFT